MLYVNMKTLPIKLGVVFHILIGLTMKPTLYTALSNQEWMDPANPWVYTTVPTTANKDHQEQTQHQNDETHHIYNNMKVMD